MACAGDATDSEIVRVLNPRACLWRGRRTRKTMIGRRRRGTETEERDGEADGYVDTDRQESLIGRRDRYRCRQVRAVDPQRKDIGCGAD